MPPTDSRSGRLRAAMSLKESSVKSLLPFKLTTDISTHRESNKPCLLARHHFCSSGLVNRPPFTVSSERQDSLSWDQALQATILGRGANPQPRTGSRGQGVDIQGAPWGRSWGTKQTLGPQPGFRPRPALHCLHPWKPLSLSASVSLSEK